ncbi:polycomb group protein FIE1-like [Macadamia integrifolia]|uniref:polycomb group protein FIE1-like n=1 Tax=Macadamia integrifolia TaxID=60698 RepID=UPI001C531C91|nr:polycomb group protein FIE1-like [Macadamia integrifolia]
MAKTGTALGCEPVIGSLTPSKKREYRVTNRLQEGKRPLYAVAFNFIDDRYYTVFATVGGNRVTVYQCLEGGVIAILQSYVDEDSFVGHGDSINEVRTQTLKPSLVISASKDESVRLWNVRTGICILIFAGAGGHRNEVLSVWIASPGDKSSLLLLDLFEVTDIATVDE